MKTCRISPERRSQEIRPAAGYALAMCHRYFRILSRFGCATLLLLAGVSMGASSAEPMHSGDRTTASVADAVEMVRIEYDAAADGSVAAISPDGGMAAFVT